MINDQTVNTNKSTGPKLVKYILSRIVIDQDNIDIMEKELDRNNKLVSEIIRSFIDTDWIRRNVNRTYAITKKCKNIIKQVELESSGM
jgi:predicted transcriptional regulator